MTFSQSVRSALTKGATFSGRACRSEYWWFGLFNVLVGVVATVLDEVLGTMVGETGVIDGLSRLALMLPDFAVTIRRLHDVRLSGWWLLTIVVPAFMAFVKGDDGANHYGPNPLEEGQIR